MKTQNAEAEIKVRITVTLDDDVARLLAQERRRSGAPLDRIVNHFLRLGLMASKRPPRRRFIVTPRNIGLPPGLSYDKVEELLELLEGSAYK